MPENAPPAPPEPPTRKTKSKLPLLIMIFAILGVIMMGASLATTWYITKFTAGGSTIEAKEDFNGYDTNGVKQSWSDMSGVNNSKALYSQTEMMVIIGLVMDILLIVGAVMLMMSPSRKMLVAVIGILALVLTMLGPVWFAAGHAPAWKADASASATTGDGPWSSFSGSSNSISWGPSTGWMVALTGFIFTLLGAILVFMVKGAPKTG